MSFINNNNNKNTSTGVNEAQSAAPGPLWLEGGLEWTHPDPSADYRKHTDVANVEGGGGDGGPPNPMRAGSFNTFQQQEQQQPRAPDWQATPPPLGGFSHVGTGPLHPGKEHHVGHTSFIIPASRFETMCQYWDASGRCDKGARCKFRHGDSEQPKPVVKQPEVAIDSYKLSNTNRNLERRRRKAERKRHDWRLENPEEVDTGQESEKRRRVHSILPDSATHYIPLHTNTGSINANAPSLLPRWTIDTLNRSNSESTSTQGNTCTQINSSPQGSIASTTYLGYSAENHFVPSARSIPTHQLVSSPCPQPDHLPPSPLIHHAEEARHQQEASLTKLKELVPGLDMTNFSPEVRRAIEQLTQQQQQQEQPVVESVPETHAGGSSLAEDIHSDGAQSQHLGQQQPQQLVLSNIPASISTSELSAAFSAFGNVLEARIERDASLPIQQQHNGGTMAASSSSILPNEGYVTMRTEYECQDAIQGADGTYLFGFELHDGRPLVVKVASGKASMIPPCDDLLPEFGSAPKPLSNVDPSFPLQPPAATQKATDTIGGTDIAHGLLGKDDASPNYVEPTTGATALNCVVQVERIPWKQGLTNYKVDLCKKWTGRGLPGKDTCPFQDRCMYAHGEAELRTMAMNIAEGTTTHDGIKKFRDALTRKNHSLKKAERRPRALVRKLLEDDPANLSTADQHDGHVMSDGPALGPVLSMNTFENW